MPDSPDVVAALQAANGQLRAENAELKAENAELRERIARLERLISRNSGNSSMPPSSDDLPGRKPPERKGGRGGARRRPGKQPGAPGAFLAWHEHPDDVVLHFPQGSCECGGDLADAADLGVRYSHQVSDLPEARAVTIQHDRHEVRCACGRRHIADAPPEAGAPGTVSYGLNFQAWCVFLLVMHHVPVERCAGILASMSGTRPSDGWVHTLLDRAARAVAAANRAIRALIVAARVICGDEIVRHEALSDRMEVRDLHRRVVAATGLKLRAA
jgi:transposase